MKVQLKKEYTVTLELTAQESLMLKAFIQNPPEGTPREISDFLHKLFNVLPEYEELS